MNEKIKNYATGDSIEFLQTATETSGEVSRFIMTLSANSSWAKSPMHFHPYQKETFKVVSGELNLKIGNQQMVLNASSGKVVVEKFVSHSFWNGTNSETTFLAEIYSPRNIEKGLRLTYKLSQQGKVNRNNLPFNPFYTLLLMSYFDSYFRLIPWKLQRFLFMQGGKLAMFLGYTDEL